MALVASYERESGTLSSNSSGTATGTVALAASFTPSVGDVLVLWFVTGTTACTPNTAPPNLTGVTWTQRIARVVGSTTPIYCWTATVTASAAITPSMPYKYTSTSGSTAAHLVIERHSGVTLPSTPNAVSTSAAVTTSGTGGATATVTLAAAGSRLSWIGADYNGVISGSPTYANGDTATQSYLMPTAGVLATWTAGRWPSSAGSQTIGFSAFSTSATRKFMLAAIELPATPAAGPLTQSCTEDFSGATLSTTKFPTQNGAGLDAAALCGTLQAYSNAGAPLYSVLRTDALYTFSGSWVVLQVPLMPTAPGESANLQFWVMDATPGAQVVARVGFEYVAAANRLDFIGQQGSSYSPIGTTTSVTYSRAHQWLRMALSGTTLIWQTSPDGYSWVTRRTLTSATSVAAWLTETNLQISVEAFRSSGVNTLAVIDNLNLPAASAGVPRWMINKASVGTVTWAAIETAADAVAADYQDANYNRQSSLGNGDASGLPWPPPIVPAPFGRVLDRAVELRLPDAARRNELQPDVAAWADGELWWEGFSFALGPDTNLSATGYQVIWQSRPDDDRGSPPVALEVFKGAIKVTGGYNRPTATYPTAPTTGSAYAYEQTALATPLPCTWYDVIIAYGVWSALGSGCFYMWINGVVVAAIAPLPGTNYPYAAGTTYPKCGLYHDAANRGATVYISDHRIGTGYGAVDPASTVREYRGAEGLTI